MEQAGIDTAAGLREAVWDVICDEAGAEFTTKWITERLPYGARVRHVLGELVRSGALVRVGYGKYQKA